MRSLHLFLTVCLAILAVGCGEDVAPGAAPEHGHGHSHDFDSVTHVQASYDCTERQDTGYVRGTPYAITVVTVDGKPVEKDTANAYWVMQHAAAAQGVGIRIVSGFRTYAEQQYLYNCYLNQNCNNGNLAARPGYSNHQSGHALDLNTSSTGVYNWLAANADAFGFKRTVSSEPWHWEWRGGGPGGGICGVCEPHCKDGSVIVGADCGEGDCSAYGSKCVDDNQGARCVFVFCPDQGTADICLDEATIAHCNNGAIETGDCSAYAASCATAGLPAGQARCVSNFCVASRDEVPIEHDGCSIDGQLMHCDANGSPTFTTCPEGQHCTVYPEVGCTDTPLCPTAGETTVCADESVLGTCNYGSLLETVDCADHGSLCRTIDDVARCVSSVCVAQNGSILNGDVCLEDGSLATCTNGEVLDVRRCEAGEVCRGACVEDTTDPDAGPGADAGDPEAGGEDIVDFEAPDDDSPTVIRGSGCATPSGPPQALPGLLLAGMLAVRRRRTRTHYTESEC